MYLGPAFFLWVFLFVGTAFAASGRSNSTADDSNCGCRIGTASGQYCGFCEGVFASGSVQDEHAYECESDGACLDIGFRDACLKHRGVTCGSQHPVVTPMPPELQVPPPSASLRPTS